MINFNINKLLSFDILLLSSVQQSDIINIWYLENVWIFDEVNDASDEFNCEFIANKIHCWSFCENQVNCIFFILSELIKCFFSKTLASLQLCISLIVTLAFILYSLFYNGYMPSKVSLMLILWTSKKYWMTAAPWGDDGCWLLWLFLKAWYLQQHQSFCQHSATSS